MSYCIWQGRWVRWNCPEAGGWRKEMRGFKAAYTAPPAQHLIARPIVSTEWTVAGHNTSSSHTERKEKTPRLFSAGARGPGALSVALKGKLSGLVLGEEPWFHITKCSLRFQLVWMLITKTFILKWCNQLGSSWLWVDEMVPFFQNHLYPISKMFPLIGRLTRTTANP